MSNGPVPMDPASLQAVSASTSNIVPGGGMSGTIVVDPASLQAASSSFSSALVGISSTSALMSGWREGSVGIADPGCDGAYGMAVSSLMSALASLGADCQQTGTAPDQGPR
ncbi:MAG: hypothetical protein M3Y91_11440 [Actinomycetota bacterium]|nr:hypothetical protein [Actinomycetota bacterium]